MRGSGRGEGSGIATAADNLFRIGFESFRGGAEGCTDGPGLDSAAVLLEHGINLRSADAHTLGGCGDTG